MESADERGGVRCREVVRLGDDAETVAAVHGGLVEAWDGVGNCF